MDDSLSPRPQGRPVTAVTAFGNQLVLVIQLTVLESIGMPWKSAKKREENHNRPPALLPGKGEGART
jgi:hypothetical protein